MNILVIGNGFDIAHGLSTQYGQFLDYIKSFMKFHDVETDGMDDDLVYNLEDFQKKEKELYDEFFSLVNNNVWISYFLSVYKERSKEGKTGWIDFESEISLVIQALDAARKSFAIQFKSGARSAKMEKWQIEILSPVFWDGKDISNYVFEYKAIQYRKEQLLKDLKALTRALEIYICCCLSFDSANNISKIEALKIDHVISFNYTNTFSMLYNNNTDIDYIHGRAQKTTSIDDNNMVLGIEEYLSGDEKNIDNEFIEFKKFYQRIYKMTGKKYKEWIREWNHKELIGKSESEEMNVYFWGHSLDPTDGDILRDLILGNRIMVHIFYHDKTALSKQIANLVKVIGEDALIELTDSVTGRIEFIPCQ